MSGPDSFFHKLGPPTSTGVDLKLLIDVGLVYQ